MSVAMNRDTIRTFNAPVPESTFSLKLLTISNIRDFARLSNTSIGTQSGHFANTTAAGPSKFTAYWGFQYNPCLLKKWGGHGDD